MNTCRGGFIDIRDVNYRLLVKPAPTSVVVILPSFRGGFIDIRDVNYRLLVKPAPTNFVVNLPRVSGAGL